jgi:hypothetical protein
MSFLREKHEPALVASKTQVGACVHIQKMSLLVRYYLCANQSSLHQSSEQSIILLLNHLGYLNTCISHLGIKITVQGTDMGQECYRYSLLLLLLNPLTHIVTIMEFLLHPTTTHYSVPLRIPPVGCQILFWLC